MRFWTGHNSINGFCVYCNLIAKTEEYKLAVAIDRNYFYDEIKAICSQIHDENLILCSNRKIL